MRYAIGLRRKQPKIVVHVTMEKAYQTCQTTVGDYDLDVGGESDLSELRENLVRNLEKLIERRQMTRAELARALGVSKPTVTRWLQREQNPTIPQVEAIAVLFDVQPPSKMFAPDIDEELHAFKSEDEAIDFLRRKAEARRKKGGS
jgi:transcriptional regulator with XRE-family HTH domain